jgi:hypothetical protein
MGLVLSRTRLGDVTVPEFLHQASDDSVALAICFGAVAVSGLIMYFSHHVGRLTGRVRLHETSPRSDLLPAEMQPAHLRQPAEAAVRERAA